MAQTIGSGSASIPVGPTDYEAIHGDDDNCARSADARRLGELVRDNITLNESKIPLLGDIPWLGWLFKTQTRNTEKLNLLVFLTPHLVRDDETYRTEYEKS